MSRIFSDLLGTLATSFRVGKAKLNSEGVITPADFILPAGGGQLLTDADIISRKLVNETYVNQRIKALSIPIDFGTDSVRGWGEPRIVNIPWPNAPNWKNAATQLMVARITAVAPNDYEEVEGQGITARFGMINPLVDFELIVSSTYSEGRGKFNVVIMGLDI